MVLATEIKPQKTTTSAHIKSNQKFKKPNQQRLSDTEAAQKQTHKSTAKRTKFSAQRTLTTPAEA
ncbi:hypothetical protein SynA1825c_00674 [Synechococcus sp. A18-25c]|nr:hypothetical protein SynA1825c_00674 [Synechococcus sp. A18-25c]